MCTTSSDSHGDGTIKLSDCGRCVWLCWNGLADTQCNVVTRTTPDGQDFQWCTVGDHGF